MVLIADSQAVRANNRRKTGNGWHTTFIGKNRNTLQEGEIPPRSGTLYPMAFLVEKDPGAVVRPHFHEADQFQVVVQGGGRFGVHEVNTVAVHYTDAWSAYGPIVAGSEGISWFTLRNSWDRGAQYMPGARAALRAARAHHQHRERTSDPMPASSPAELARLGRTERIAGLDCSPDGLATSRLRLPAGACALGPDPATGGGQFWIVLAGEATCEGSELLPVLSCTFVAPADPAPRFVAGPEGAELLGMQFPRLAQAAH